MKKMLLLAVLFASSAQAAKYGMAGCGLGSLVIGDKPGKVQIVSSLLNSWGSQTSAITTGTSNCTESAGSVADLRYIEENFKSLQADVAKGNGETVSGLLNIWGCDQNAAQDLKAGYSNIYSEKNIAIIQVRDSMKQSLKQSCGKI